MSHPAPVTETPIAPDPVLELARAVARLAAQRQRAAKARSPKD